MPLQEEDFFLPSHHFAFMSPGGAYGRAFANRCGTGPQLAV